MSFAKYDGADGSATASGYEKWVQTRSLQFVSTRSGLTGTSGALAQQRNTGMAQLGPITIRQDLDKSFPKLLEAMLGGKMNKKIEYVETQTVAGKLATVVAYTFENNLFTGVRQVSDETGSYAEIEIMPLKVECKYTEYDPKDGSKKGDVAGKADMTEQKAG